MALMRHQNPAVRVLTSAEPDVCPHCGSIVELVTVCGIARIRCDPEEPVVLGDDRVTWVRIMHLCDDPTARRLAIRDLVGQIPKG